MKLKSVLFSIAFLSVLLLQAKGKPKINSVKPDWVSKTTIDYSIEFDDANTSGGVYYYQDDYQHNLVTETTYYASSYQLLSSEGVQNNSDISIDYDPSYQELIFHAIDIIRDGKRIKKLDKSKLRSLQREERMDRHLYDGGITVVQNLEDVRIGDIIEYSFSRIGFNPIKKGHFGVQIQINYNVPIQKIKYQLVAPINKEVYIKNINHDRQPEISEKGNMKFYLWEIENPVTVITDTRKPAWIPAYQFIKISVDNSWEKIVEWGLKNYSVADVEKSKISKNLDLDIQGLDKKKGITKAIRFVQDEIRYLGFENGISAFEPHPPSQILEQRFGDCKDKSLLLCTILDLIEIDANPVLVNSGRIYEEENFLPSLNSFDHCIVHIPFEGKDYFIDPTISNQGGELDIMYMPDYGKGLIIREGEKKLQVIKPQDFDVTKIEEVFRLNSIGGDGTLVITTESSGSRADENRDYFQRNSQDKIKKSYIDFYANQYEGIEFTDEIEIKDDKDLNKITVIENYDIESPWYDDEEVSGTLNFDVIPNYFSSHLNSIKLVKRKHDYYFGEPLEYKIKTTVHMPEDWSVTDEKTKVENDYFYFEEYASCIGNIITVHTTYQRKKSIVKAEDFLEFAKLHNKIYEKLGYTFYYGEEVESEDSLVFDFVGYLVLIGIILLVVKLLNVGKT